MWLLQVCQNSASILGLKSGRAPCKYCLRHCATMDTIFHCLYGREYLNQYSSPFLTTCDMLLILLEETHLGKSQTVRWASLIKIHGSMRQNFSWTQVGWTGDCVGRKIWSWMPRWIASETLADLCPWMLSIEVVIRYNAQMHRTSIKYHARTGSRSFSIEDSWLEARGCTSWQFFIK